MIQVSQELTTNAYSGILARADKIAYSTSTDADGDEIMQQSIKSKIDQIASELENIDNSESMEQIQNAVSQARSSATAAVNAQNAAQAAQQVIETTKDKLDRVEDLAKTFSTGFDADATFSIVSTNEYNAVAAAGRLNPNCIYFCYDI